MRLTGLSRSSPVRPWRTLHFPSVAYASMRTTISWRAGLQLPTSGLYRTSNPCLMTPGTHSSSTSSSNMSRSSPTLKVLHSQPRPNADKEWNHQTQHRQERSPRSHHRRRRRRSWRRRQGRRRRWRRRRRRRRRCIGAWSRGRGHPAGRREGGRRRRAGQGATGGGERISEPFVGCLIPWHNCHGGAWNKALLITHTRVHIEWDQQHGQAKKSGYRKLGISMDIPRIYHVYTWSIYVVISKPVCYYIRLFFPPSIIHIMSLLKHIMSLLCHLCFYSFWTIISYVKFSKTAIMSLISILLYQLFFLAWTIS